MGVRGTRLKTREHIFLEKLLQNPLFLNYLSLPKNSSHRMEVFNEQQKQELFQGDLNRNHLDIDYYAVILSLDFENPHDLDTIIGNIN